MHKRVVIAALIAALFAPAPVNALVGKQRVLFTSAGVPTWIANGFLNGANVLDTGMGAPPEAPGIVITTTGTFTAGSKNITGIVGGTTNMGASMGVTGNNIPASTNTISTVVNSSQINMAGVNATASINDTFQLRPRGGLTNGIASIANLQARMIANMLPGMLALDPVGVYAGSGGGKLRVGSYIRSIDSTTQITLNLKAFGAVSGDRVVLFNPGGLITNGSNSIANVYLPQAPKVGSYIVGWGLPPKTKITAAPSGDAAYQAGTGSLTISNAAVTAVRSGVAGPYYSGLVVIPAQ